MPRALPALVEAQQIASRAAGVGFDWENPEQVLDKLQEELAEFDEARRNHSPVQLEDELGDLLFVLVNLARFVKVDPEQARRVRRGRPLAADHLGVRRYRDAAPALFRGVRKDRRATVRRLPRR